MHARRGLLLFAVVVASAAIAASLAPPPEDEPEEQATTATSPPPTSEEPPSRPPARGTAGSRELTLRAVPRRPGRVRVRVDEPATLRVEVAEPAEVELEGLGLIRFAEPGTPAVFELLLEQPGRHQVLLRPTEGDPARAGTVVAVSG